MKLSIPKTFETETALAIFKKAKIDGLDRFFDDLSQVVSQVTSALRNKLTAADNMNVIEREFALRHDVDTLISPGDLEGRVRAIIPLKVMPYANPITSFAWEYTVTDEIRCRVKFDGSPANPCTVLLRMEL